MQETPFSILLLTEQLQINRTLLALLATELSAASGRFVIEQRPLEQWMQLPLFCIEQPCDLIVLDFFTTVDLAVVRQIHDLMPTLPLIVAGADPAQDTGIDVIEAGAQEYLDRGQMDATSATYLLHKAWARAKTQQREVRRQSEQRFRHVLEMSPDLICIHNGRQILYGNPALLNALGLNDPRHFLGHALLDFVHPDDRAEVMHRAGYVLQTGQPTTVGEQRWLQADGSILDLEALDIPVSPEGEPAVLTILRNIRRRKQAEAAARQAHNVLVETLDRMSDIVFGVDRAWRFIYFNQRAGEFLGKPAREMIGQNLWQAYPALIGSLYETHYRAAMRQRQPRHFEAQSAVSKRWYSVSVYPSGDGLMIFSRDISDRKAAEEMLREAHDELEHRVRVRTQALVASNQQLQQEIAERKQAEETLRYQTALLAAQSEAAADGILVVSPERAWLAVNQRFVEMWQIPEPVLEQRSSALALEAVLDQVVEPERFLAKIDYLYTHPDETSWDEVLLKNGSVFMRYSAPVVSDTGVFYGRVWYYRDITERKRAEAQLRERERQLQEAQELAHLGSWEWDIRINHLTWSRELYRIYGLEADQLAPTFEGFLARVHPADREWVQQRIEWAYESCRPFVFEHRIVRPDGDVRVLEARGTVVLDDKERPIKMIGTGQDCTARSILEAELAEVRRRLDESRETERLYLAQELHDLPLQELYAVQMTLHSLPATDEVAQAQVQFARECVDRVMQMLRGLVNELRPPMLEAFGLPAVIRNYAEQLQRQQALITIHVEVTMDEPEQDETGENDDVEEGKATGKAPLSQAVGLALFRIYQQALHNIVKHAAASEVWVRLFQEGNHVVLEVQDNGCGFEVPERWVDLTRQNHFGLAGSAERAEHVGGHFSVESTPGVGTTVRVRVPLAE